MAGRADRPSSGGKAGLAARGPWNWRWRRRRHRRAIGCLLWLVTLLFVLLVLSLLFGGFQKGTQTGGGGLVGSVPVLAAGTLLVQRGPG